MFQLTMFLFYFDEFLIVLVSVSTTFPHFKTFAYFYRYNMVFVPTTWIDNHEYCVTFGSDFLSGEIADLYKWLLCVFLQAFGKQSMLVVIDQDPTIKSAVAIVFIESTHKLLHEAYYEKNVSKGMWEFVLVLQIEIASIRCHSKWVKYMKAAG